MSSSQIRRSARTLRSCIRRAHSKAFGAARRATKDYATHLPILVGLAHAFTIENALELGCGDFSTLTFLKKDVFQHLRQLISCENDHLWLERISNKVDDPRFTTRLVTSSIATAVARIDLEDFDLVFVDDSSCAEERQQTLRQIQQKQPKRPLVVIHDFEVNEYRLATESFQHRHIFKTFTPQTGVVWNGSDGVKPALRNIDRLIKRFKSSYEPDDVSGWKTAFIEG